MVDSYDSDILDHDEEKVKKKSPIQKKKKKEPIKEQKKMTIDHFGTDFTEEASKKNLDPVIGRDREMDQVIYTLLRKTKANPILI